jgi:hypothetical protein
MTGSNPKQAQTGAIMPPKHAPDNTSVSKVIAFPRRPETSKARNECSAMNKRDRKNGAVPPSHETSTRDLTGFRHLLEKENMRLPADLHAALQQVERMKYWLEQMIAAEGGAK